jgi:hypothetical protein
MAKTMIGTLINDIGVSRADTTVTFSFDCARAGR